MIRLRYPRLRSSTAHLLRLGLLLGGWSCGPPDGAEPLRSTSLSNVNPASGGPATFVGGPPAAQEYAIDPAQVKRGPTIYGIIDVGRWQDSIVVLDRHGLLWISGPSMGPVRRVVSLRQAFEDWEGRALTVLGGPEGLGAWDPTTGRVLRLSPDGARDAVTSISVDPRDLQLSVALPFGPPRMHGRAVFRDQHMYLELRRGDQQAHGPTVDAALVRYGEAEADTLLNFDAPSQAELRDGVWICCRRSPIFAPQPWWALLSDRRVVFADGRSNELILFSERGTPLRKVSWEPTARQRPLSARDFTDYLALGVRRTFAHESRRYIRSLESEVEERVRRLPGALSDAVPALTQLIVDEEDRIWVRRFDRTRWPDGLSDTWDLFDSDLAYMGWISLPMLDYVYEIREGSVLGSVIVHGALQQIVSVAVDVRQGSTARGPD